MFGLGTLINCVGILVGGILGLLFGKVLKERQQDSLKKVCGVSTLFIGIGGALEGMLTVSDGTITSGRSFLIIICLALGAIVGEIINIDGGIERLGEWLKKKTGNAKDNSFVEGFVTASITVSVGAMAIIGAIEDALYGDISILLTKTILDTIVVMIMTGSLGKGCIFSLLPVLVIQGLFTALAKLIQPIMTETALTNLGIVGSVLIFCVGVNLVWGKKIAVANFVPAIIFAVAFAFIPIGI